MYNHIWKKYLPFIRIQLKRSASGDQLLDLNRIDFERAGTGRKAGYKFNIIFNNGRVGNIISSSPLAVHLASVMLEDDATKAILKDNQYEISLNTKFQLTTKNLAPAPEETVTETTTVEVETTVETTEDEDTEEEEVEEVETTSEEEDEEDIETVRSKSAIVGTE